MPKPKRSGPTKLEQHRAVVDQAAKDLQGLNYELSILSAAVSKLKERRKRLEELAKLKREVEKLESEL